MKILEMSNYSGKKKHTKKTYFTNNPKLASSKSGLTELMVAVI